MAKTISFDDWRLREMRTDPLASFNGLTSCEKPEHAIAIFTTAKGREIEASTCDVRIIDRVLSEEVTVSSMGNGPSPARLESIKKQKALLQEASSAFNERRNMGVLEPGLDTGLFGPSAPQDKTVENYVSDALKRIARESRVTGEKLMHQREDAKLYMLSFVAEMQARADQQRAQQLASLAKARAAKAAKRTGATGRPA